MTSNITAIVTVADDGGSSGKLRSEFGLPPMGDIRNCIAALADAEPAMTRLLQYRFQNRHSQASERDRQRLGRDDGFAGHRLRQPADRRSDGHHRRLRGGSPAVEPGPGGAWQGRPGCRSADHPSRRARRRHCRRGRDPDRGSPRHQEGLDQPSGHQARGRGGQCHRDSRPRDHWARQPVHEPPAGAPRPRHSRGVVDKPMRHASWSATSRHRLPRRRATPCPCTWPRLPRMGSRG